MQKKLYKNGQNKRLFKNYKNNKLKNSILKIQ